MPLPRSTFVMGGVVLAIFGVAAYQTTSRPPQGPPEPDRDSYAVRMAEEEAEARRAELAREREDFEAAVAALASLHGAEAASLGFAFDGIVLGRDPDAIAGAVQDRVHRLEQVTGSAIAIAQNRITLNLFREKSFQDRDRLCTKVEERLHDAWGTGQAVEEPFTSWQNPVTRQRAALADDSSGCVLVFDRYVTVEEWVAAFPIQLVGKPAAAAEKVAGAEATEEWLSWPSLGIGASASTTLLEAKLVRGRVQWVNAMTIANERTRTELAELLVTKYGTPKRKQTDGDGTVLSWPRARIELQIDDESVTLTAGAR